MRPDPDRRRSGICALLALALPGASVLAGHYGLSLEGRGLELQHRAFELGPLSVLSLLLVLLFVRTERPVAELPAPLAAGFVFLRPDPPVASALVRPHPSRGPPA